MLQSMGSQRLRHNLVTEQQHKQFQRTFPHLCSNVAYFYVALIPAYQNHFEKEVYASQITLCPCVYRINAEGALRGAEERIWVGRREAGSRWWAWTGGLPEWNSPESWLMAGISSAPSCRVFSSQTQPLGFLLAPWSYRILIYSALCWCRKARQVGHLGFCLFFSYSGITPHPPRAGCAANPVPLL